MGSPWVRCLRLPLGLLLGWLATRAPPRWADAAEKGAGTRDRPVCGARTLTLANRGGGKAIRGRLAAFPFQVGQSSTRQILIAAGIGKERWDYLTLQARLATAPGRRSIRA